MAEEGRPGTERPTERRDGPIVATTQRTGEGDVYYTGPRATAEPRLTAAPPTFAVLRDRVRWGPILAGLVTALTALTVFLMLGAAIGLTAFGPCSSSGAVTTAVGIWSAVSAFIALILGGWVAGKTAAVDNADNSLLNGFLVGAALVVLLLVMAVAGVGNLFGLIGGAAGGVFHAAASNPGALQHALTDASPLVNNAANNANVSGAQAQAQASTGAWYVFISIVVGLIAATIGGWLGFVSRHGHDLDAYGLPRTARER
jgi:hypothetical protein